ncbi:MAG: hypothetical protein P4N60_01050 [Verrucomicrobiae bacterium]|nr:hypothetical protein [Verrucomicrobiae bacterium]
MDRPIPPDPEECPKIKKAMRAARFMKWGATPVSGVCLMAAVISGITVAWYLGVIILVVTWLPLFISGYRCARCPRCGQVWWSGLGTVYAIGGWLAVGACAEQEDETESFVCRRCRLNIGLGLR